MVEPVPPLLLTADQIVAALENGLAELGGLGGAIGGAIGGGVAGGRLTAAAGGLGGASGGATGARWGTRKFTKLDGRRWFRPGPPPAAAMERLQTFLASGVRWDLTAPGGSPAIGLVSIVGSGSMNMNPCVIEALWDSAGLQVAAHAREGLIKQHTCDKALSTLQEAVFGTAST